MSLSAFLAQNAVKIENEKYVASNRFLDEKKKPIEWEIRAISSAEDEEIRKCCTKRIPMPGKRGQYTQDVDYNAYVAKLCVACTAYPNLNDKELQDSYGVMGAEATLKAMLIAGEYGAYATKVQEVCGFDMVFQDLVEDAKN